MQGISICLKRGFSTSPSLWKEQAHNLKGKSVSSQNWIKRQLSDPYVKKSRYQNYRARSAFKLLEIDDAHHILARGMKVVECGAAPGAWTQVLVQRVIDLDPEPGKEKGVVISVDRAPFTAVEGAYCLPHTDFTLPLNQARILRILNGSQCNVVLSDMAPNATGTRPLDHEGIMQLVYTALSFSVNVLEKDGTFLAKIFNGALSEKLMDHASRFFTTTNWVKPPASRSDSSETFILCRGFKGIKQ